MRDRGDGMRDGRGRGLHLARWWIDMGTEDRPLSDLGFLPCRGAVLWRGSRRGVPVWRVSVVLGRNG